MQSLLLPDFREGLRGRSLLGRQEQTDWLSQKRCARILTSREN
jgi:hypothetical protein